MTQEYDNIVHWLISGSGQTELSRCTLVPSYVGMGVSGPRGLILLGAQPGCLSTRHHNGTF